jgi:hypothetical protein
VYTFSSSGCRITVLCSAHNNGQLRSTVIVSIYITNNKSRIFNPNKPTTNMNKMSVIFHVLHEYRAILGAANKCYFSLKKHHSNVLSRKFKCLIYEIQIRPQLTCCSKTWTISKHGQNILRLFEREVLQKYLAWYSKMDVVGAKSLIYIYIYIICIIEKT